MPQMEGLNNRQGSKTHLHFLKNPKKITFLRFKSKRRLLTLGSNRKSWLINRRRIYRILVLKSKKNKDVRIITLRTFNKDTKSKNNKKQLNNKMSKTRGHQNRK
jgi:hypothetical protein